MFEMFLDPVATCLRDKGETRPKGFDEVTAMRQSIIEGQRIWLNGQHDQAHQHLDALLARATAFGFGALPGEVQLMRAILAGGDRDVAKLEESLRKALHTSESSGDDRTKTIAATRLAVALLNRSLADEAEQMIDQATASLARYGTDISLEPELAFARGKLAHARKRFTDAEKLLLESIELAEVMFFSDGDAKFELAALYVSMGREGDAKRIRDGMMNQLPKPDVDASVDDPIKGAARQMELTKRCGLSWDADVTALEAKCREAVALVEREFGVGDQLSATMHKLNAELLDILDRSAEAFEHYLRAAKVFETANNRSELVPVYEGCGRMQLDLKDFDKAIEYFQKAIDTGKTVRGVDTDLAFATAGLGRALVGKGRFEEAIPKLEEGLVAYAKIVDDPPYPGIARARLELAKARWARGGKTNRDDAKLDAQIGLQAIKKHRAIQAEKPASQLKTRILAGATKRITEIEAWIAGH
jgi:tetratricopeptide (TPR) repeat protein